MPTRFFSDTRMLELMVLLRITGAIRSQVHFCEIIGANPTDIDKIRNGMMSFSAGQIEQTVKQFGIDANFLFGVGIDVYRGQKNSRELDQLIMKIRNGKIDKTRTWKNKPATPTAL